MANAVSKFVYREVLPCVFAYAATIALVAMFVLAFNATAYAQAHHVLNNNPSPLASPTDRRAPC